MKMQQIKQKQRTCGIDVKSMFTRNPCKYEKKLWQQVSKMNRMLS